MSRRGPSERVRISRRSLGGGLLTLSVAGCGGRGGPGPMVAEESTHPLVGAPAPPFELSDVTGGGGSRSPGAYAGKVLLVDFWATWCEPCKLSFPAYQRLLTELGGSFAIIAVSQDDDSKGIPGFVAETGVKFPVVWDEGKSVAKTYDPPTMPTAYLLDQSGIVRFVHQGYRRGDEALIKERVRSLLG